jgi:hypothetical protein
MTRRTPVGILVVALASLSAVGCSAQTSAVFQAMLAPAIEPVAPVEPVEPAPPSAAVVGVPVETWWPHPDGYAMVLPAGWSGVALDETQAGQLVDAVVATDADLAARIDGILESTDSRISAIAAETAVAQDLGPLVIVLAQPTQDRGAHAVKSLVKEQIAGLPGLSGGPFRDDVTLPYASGVQFEFTIDDPALGALQVRALLFRFGSDAYLVSFVAPVAEFESVEAIFEAIAASLRFGV